MATRHIDELFEPLYAIDWDAYEMNAHPFKTTLARLPDGHLFPHGCGGYSCGHEECPADRPEGREHPIAAHTELHGY